jgi:fructose-specific phosphotransferase system IIA component
MRLTDILSPNCIKIPMSATDKKAAIAEMVDLIDAAGKLSDRDQMFQAALEREATRTTGIGNGLAIPHGKCAAVKELIMAVGKPAQPIDFGSIDGKPVTVVIFLASPPDKTGPHIQALARISRLMTDQKFRKALEEAQTSEGVYNLIASCEAKAQL